MRKLSSFLSRFEDEAARQEVSQLVTLESVLTRKLKSQDEE